MNKQRKEEQETAPRRATLGTAFQENAARIYAFIYAKVGNRETAEDLTSQVFLKAARWLAADASGDSTRAWLYASSRTAIVDYWREQSRLQTVPLEDWQADLFCGTDDAAEVRRSRARAERVLEALPKREREVLRLRFLRGYSAPEVARTLGITPGHVRVVQLRALRRAARLDPGGTGPAIDHMHMDRGADTDAITDMEEWQR